MALIECKECGQQISDKAEFCPHCGLPLVKRTERVYRLKKGNVSENSFANFLHGAAIVVAIAGLILSIVGANQPVTSYYGTKTVFSWSVFLSTLASYAEYAFVLWSLGTVVDMIQDTRDMVWGIELEQDVKDAVPQASPAGSAPSYKAPVVPQRKNFTMTASLDEAKYALCPRCNTVSPIDVLSAKSQCPKCGASYPYYKDVEWKTRSHL